MELDKLKLTWQSIKPRIEIEPLTEKTNINYKKDMKTQLIRQSNTAIVCLSATFILMATSRFWFILELPIWWISVFCATIIFEIICLLIINRLLRSTNLYEDTNSKIMQSIISIKKIYRNMELTIFIIIASILMWLSFTPPFINTWSMVFVWMLTAIAFIAEYFYYKSYTNQLTRLVNWDNE